MQIYAVFGSDFDANAQHVDCDVKKPAIINFLTRARARLGVRRTKAVDNGRRT
jgi:hypothetical protein